jgi:hypothetical protein
MDYQLHKLGDPIYPYMVWSVSYMSPTEKLDEIGGELIKLNYQGLVLFDLLLCNGLAENRFMVAYFDGRKFDISCFRSVDPGEEIRQKSVAFYIDNGLLSRGVLSETAQQKLKDSLVRVVVWRLQSGPLAFQCAKVADDYYAVLARLSDGTWWRTNIEGSQPQRLIRALLASTVVNQSLSHPID